MIMPAYQCNNCGKKLTHAQSRYYHFYRCLKSVKDRPHLPKDGFRTVAK